MNDEFDPGTPSVARMYDRFLDGKDNFAADREAARQITGLSDSAATAARDNRRFIKRAVSYTAGLLGVTQFLDIGAGIPTAENTHQIAACIDPASRVVYVDNDPLAVYHGMAMSGSPPQAVTVKGDLGEPQKIMEDPAVRSVLDFTQPVAVILAAVLHFLTDTEAYGSVSCLKEALPAGSVLVISHATADDASPAEIEKVTAVYEQAKTPIFLRSLAEVTRFFDSFDLEPPGVVDANAWQDSRRKPAQVIGYAGVAVKPTRTVR
jgi:S-adenosyl methyltransferase